VPPHLARAMLRPSTVTLRTRASPGTSTALTACQAPVAPLAAVLSGDVT
jgi:hypothetical protein